MGVRPRRGTRGQALIMITFSLVAMFGVMGLAIDMGWGYFIKKSAQKAADASALAAVGQALTLVGQTGAFTCGTQSTCQALASCAPTPSSPPATNIDTACLYAKQNGFSVGGTSRRQNVMVEAGTTNPIPTAPGIQVDYWVTVRATEVIPQLFSAVLNFPFAQSSARATAAVADIPLTGSVYLLNRENDGGPNGTGVDASLGGGGSLTASGGIYLSSSANGSVGNQYAGETNGSASVTGAYVGIRGNGTVDHPNNWLPTPSNTVRDPNGFKDPMRGKGQPPAPAALEVPDRPVPGGTISGSNGCVTLQPGTYYATTTSNGQTVASGRPLTFSGCVNFSDGGAGFGNYVFFGGLKFSGGTTTFAPGRYMVAGATQGNSLLSAGNGNVITDQTPLSGGQSVLNSDAGEIFVFTDANYSGLWVPPLVKAIQGQLNYSAVDIQMGNTANSYINLHGLNVSDSAVPDELKAFGPTVWWQDQGNSRVKYLADGNIDISCGSLDDPCKNSGNISPDIHLQAHANTWLNGLFYQPRGASINFQGQGGLTSPLTIITGSISLQGSPTVLQPYTGVPLARRMAVLVE